MKFNLNIKLIKESRKLIITLIAVIILIVVLIFWVINKQDHEINDNDDLVNNQSIKENIIDIENSEGIIDKKKHDDETHLKSKSDSSQVEDKKKLNEKSKRSQEKFKPQKKEKEIKVVTTYLNPKNTIEKLHLGLKKISANESQVYHSILDLVRNTYFVEKMISMIVGKVWKQTQIEKKIEMKKVFEEYIAKNYIKRFKKMKNINFKIIEINEIQKNYIIVKSILKVEDSENIKIDYLLSKDGKSWKIFDILLAGSVSEIATKKSEFRSFIKNGNLDKLIEALRKKNFTILE
jgi:ABC-type transporter MlaC component